MLEFFRRLRALAREQPAHVIAVDFEVAGGQLKLTFRGGQ